MPSASLVQWQTDQLPRLREIDAQCAAVQLLTPPNLLLLEESLRGYVVLLSAHFQGFCRSLYTESSLVIGSKVRARLRVLVLEQFAAHVNLSHGNPNLHNIAKDFDRFGFELRPILTSDPTNARRLQHLATLNAWRNVAAHQGTAIPPGGPLTLSRLRGWSAACNELAVTLDAIVYDQLRRILRRNPLRRNPW